MLGYLDNLLRHLFISQIAEIKSELQVRFEAPDDDWKTYVASLAVNAQAANALNIYLVDIRENRKLRSNERIKNTNSGSGVITQEPSPARVDCHYLISAWSPATANAAVEPIIDVHQLLYNVAAVLLRNVYLNPSKIYSKTDMALKAWPKKYQDIDLPFEVISTDGFQKISEFWSSMGASNRWKPVVYLVVSLPVEMLTEIAGPMVTTRITEYRYSNSADTADYLVQIRGTVIDSTVNPEQVVKDSWIQLRAKDGTEIKSTTSNEQGHFMFNKLPAGDYELRWQITGKEEPAIRKISVPSPTGEYDLVFK